MFPCLPIAAIEHLNSTELETVSTSRKPCLYHLTLNTAVCLERSWFGELYDRNEVGFLTCRYYHHWTLQRMTTVHSKPRCTRTPTLQFAMTMISRLGVRVKRTTLRNLVNMATMQEFMKDEPKSTSTMRFQTTPNQTGTLRSMFIMDIGILLSMCPICLVPGHKLE